MNSYYYHQPHHVLLQQQYYYVPISAVSYVDDVSPRWVMNQQPVHSYTQYNHYIPTLFNFNTPVHHPFASFPEETLIMQQLEAAHHPPPAAAAAAVQQQQQQQQVSNGSGLSEEEISEHLHVYTAQGNCEAVQDNCCICLDEYDETNQEIGRLRCGHRYHADCIRRWLLSKNVCPMCRSTAFAV